MGKTHDYTRRHWGHDYTVTDVKDVGNTLRAMGWGTGIRAGDYLLMENEGGSTRYKVDTISYYMDPRDMWKATLTFSPRQAVSNG